MLLHNIKSRCKECGITLKQLEQTAGLSPNSIFRWDETMPAADKLVRVAKALETTSEDLLHD